ncbi:MAG: RNA-binding S4 domain-containing protein [Rhodospirillaceae bacterium]|nr:RNA-binding S4 domain-containing protein [Rhodospirillaceae bacterium]
MTRDAPALAASRLDKWLWYARFFKTRGLAQKACETGRIRVNGRRITKAHRTVGPGDVLTFVQGRMVRIVRILAVAERRGPAPEARKLYEEIEQE